ncbi:MAG: APC family permease [Acidobacteriota bacterium]
MKQSTQLFREVNLSFAIFLVIGNIIGTGIFTISGLIAQELGISWWLIGIWILGGILALIGAICYSVLGIEIPKAGGEYAFLYPYYGPLPAFLSGWASLFIGFSAPIAAAALGLAYYLQPLIGLGSAQDIVVLKGIAMIALVAITIVISMGLQTGTRLHSLLTFANLGLVAGFAVLVLWRAPLRTNLTPILTGSPIAVDFTSLGSAILLVMFTYSGWNAAAYMAEEIRQPRRNIPTALILGTSLVIIIYLTINLAYFGAVPFSELEGEIAVAEITATRMFGTTGSLIISWLITFSFLTSITAMSIAGPRVYFAMSRNRLFPHRLSQVHAKKKVPVLAIWFQSIIALVLIAVGSFYQILLYAGGILVLFATLTVSVLFQIPSNGKPFFTLLYRILPAIFVLVNTGVLVATVISHPTEAMAGLLTVALGIPVYMGFKGR